MSDYIDPKGRGEKIKPEPAAEPAKEPKAKPEPKPDKEGGE